MRTIVTLIVLFLLMLKAEAKPSAFLFYSDSIQVDSIEYTKKTVVKKKLTATALAIALGPFGMHRLYLGTDYRVPIVYSVTLGAFGILPLIDIVAIVVNRDITKLENNAKLVMWLN